MTPSNSSPSIPSSILIIGSGVFGLSTAYALSQRAEYNSTQITLLDRSPFPAPDAASVDSSRIVRADYAKGAYAALMGTAAGSWRGAFGADGRYTQAGLCLVVDGTASPAQRDVLRQSLANIQDRLGLRAGARDDGADFTILPDADAIRAAVPGMGGDLGDEGYVNWTSGWADAEAGLRYMRSLVEASGRVEFQVANVDRLLFEKTESGAARVAGAITTAGERVTAEQTILAAGAWTPRLLDLRGVASASGQVLAYAALTPAEQERLGTGPTLIDEGTGCFIIPPRGGVLKVARHGYGYANPTRIPHPEREAGSAAADEEISVSLPCTKQDVPDLQIPAEGSEVCRAYLAKCIPDLATRPWTDTRICWYLDTATGDFLIDHHPRYEGLFVATGGSGHGYKFLPVIGERIVDVMQQRDRDELGAELRGLWQWPAQKWHEDHIVTNDWRGGPKGMILKDELRKTST